MSTQVINARAQAAQGVITLSPPAAGDQFVFQALDGLKVALGFPADGATMAQDGQNLTFSFPDGGQIVLTDFFAQYGTGAAPSFIVEGQELPGDAFLTAFNADLLPAAGPAGGGGAGSGGVGDYQSDPGALINTVDRLGALDPSQFPEGVPQVVLLENGLVDNGVTIIDLTSGGPGLGIGEGQVFESGLGNRTGDQPIESPGTLSGIAATSMTGDFTVLAPDGLATVTIGGITVISGGALVANPVVTGPGFLGTLTITGYNAATGQITYRYDLKENADHTAGDDSVRETFAVTATDTDGDSASGSLTLKIVDDAPTIGADNGVKVDESFYFFSKPAEEEAGSSVWQGHSLHKEGSLSFKAGADGVESIVFNDAMLVKDDTSALHQLTSQGQSVFYELSNKGQTLTAYVQYSYSEGGDTAPSRSTVFVMTIKNDGHYEYTQYRPLDHAEDGATFAAHDDALTLPIAVVVTDRDGDKAYGDIKVTVEDAGPFVIPSAAMVDESAFDHHNRLETAKAMNVDTKDGEQQQDIWGNGYIHTSGKLAYFAGADGVGDFTLHTPLEQLTSQGEKVSFTVLPGGHTLIGYVGEVAPTGNLSTASNIVMVATIDKNGHYEYTQYRPLDHSVDGVYPPATATKFPGFTPNPHDDALTVKIGVTITDGDGDTASSKIIVVIKDDGPEKATSEDNVEHCQLDSLHIDFGKTNISSNIFVGDRELTGSSIADPTTGNDGWITDRVQMQVNGGTPYYTKGGLGVTYDGMVVNTSDGPDRENEIGYRDKHTHGSIEHAAKQEGIVFELNGLANSFKLDASSAFFEKEGERGEVKFYLGSEELSGVTSRTLDNGLISFDAGARVFDRVVVTPVDHTTGVTGDNSDFYIKSVDFGFVSQVGTAEGTITPNYGADGKGDLTFGTLSTEIYTYDGHKVTVAPTGDGHMLKGTYGTQSDVAFTISINPDTGKWNFEQKIPLDIDNSLKSKLTFNVTIKDGDGDTAPGTITVGITEHERAPDVDTGLSPHVVFEAGLSDGSHVYPADYAPKDDANGPLVTTGTFFINTAGEDLTEVSIAGHVFSGTKTSNGYSIPDLINTTIKLNAHGLEAKDGDPVHATLTINDYDAGKVSYTYTLTDNVFHGDTIAGNTFDRDKTGDIIPIKVTTGGGTANATLTVTIVDDVSKATADIVEYTGITTNLVIMMDRSGSMDGASGISGKTRWDVALKGMEDLIDSYAKLGSVNVKIVDFYNGKAGSSTWYTATAGAKVADYFKGKEPDGGTSYDAATAKVMSELKDGLPPADKSIAYLLSDGKPEPTTAGLYEGEVTAWEAFLKTTPISEVFAFGIGSNTSALQLGAVAWNGSGADHITTVTDLTQFSAALLATVPITGNLLTNDHSADGIALLNFSVDGKVYDISKADATTHQLTVDFGGGKGKLTVDFDDGSYIFMPGSTQLQTKEVSYTITDADGDQCASTLTLKLLSPSLDAHDNHAAAAAGNLQTSVDTFDSGLNGWSGDTEPSWLWSVDDPDGEVSNQSQRLEIALENGGGNKVATQKTFTVGENEKVTLSFDWETLTGKPNSNQSHDSDTFKVIIDGPKGSGTTQDLYMAKSTDTEGNGGKGKFYEEFTTKGTYTVTLVVADGTSGSRDGNMKALVDNVTITHAMLGAPLIGNLVTDHLGSDTADHISGLTATVCEVNGQAIAQNGTYTEIATDQFGSLKVNMYGQYEYKAYGGTAGHDEAFVYKLVSTTGQEDHATLNIHIGDAGTSVTQGTYKYGSVIVGGHDGADLNGTPSADYIVGGKLGEVIDGKGGHDYIDGGAGNDTIIARDTTGDHRITDADFKGLHGGSGADTLKIVGDGVTLDFTNIADGKVSGIEKIDLSASGEQNVKLSVHDLLDMGKSIAPDDHGKITLTITGGTKNVDHVELVGDGWSAPTQATTPNHVDYKILDGTTEVHLIVQQEIIKSGG